MSTAIKVENLHKKFVIRGYNSIRGSVYNLFNLRKSKDVVVHKVLKGINFEVQKGEIFGIIGKNGSGKSTLMKCIKGCLPLDSGVIETKGKMMRLALGQGLEPALSARQNIYLNASLLGLTFAEIGQVFDEIIAFAGLEDFVDTEIKYYSNGMRSRLAFAIAQYAKTDIMLLDEFFGGVGDIEFKKKSRAIFEKDMLQERTVVIISHNLHQIRNFCDRAALIHHGEIIAIGDPNLVVDAYQDLDALEAQ